MCSKTKTTSHVTQETYKTKTTSHVTQETYKTKTTSHVTEETYHQCIFESITNGKLRSLDNHKCQPY